MNESKKFLKQQRPKVYEDRRVSTVIKNMKKQTVKIVVGVPESHTNSVLEVLGNAGAGRVGNYSHCSSVVKAVGHWKPLPGAHPAIGKIGQLESAVEDRIETWCEVLPPLRRTGDRCIPA